MDVLDRKFGQRRRVGGRVPGEVLTNCQQLNLTAKWCSRVDPRECVECYVKQGENRLMTLLKFFRYTSQGIAIASLGTLGAGSWQALIEGLLMLFTAMALLHFEKKGDVQ